MFDIRPAEFPRDLDEVRSLFREYADAPVVSARDSENDAPERS